jgi:hypothetical protein
MAASAEGLLSETLRVVLFSLGILVALAAIYWPPPTATLDIQSFSRTTDVPISDADLLLQRGAATELSWRFVSIGTMKGGIFWRDGVVHYMDGASKEITAEELKAKLTAEEWAQVESAIRERQ